MLDRIRLELRDAWRALAAARGVSIVAALTLALGIAGATSIFTLVYSVLLRPLPYGAADRLTVVWETRRDRSVLTNSVSPANFLAWRDANRTFSGMAAVSLTFRATLTGRGGPAIELPMQLVSHELLDVLQVRPALGRGFLSSEDRQGSAVAMISHRLWQQRFGGDPGIVGRTMTLNGLPVRVVGVLPPGFAVLDDTIDLWAPIGFDASSRKPHGRWIKVVARLRPGVSITRAQADMVVIAARLAREWPDFDTNWGANVVSIEEQVLGAVRRPLALVGAAALLLLLIAGANVAGLLLARASARQRDMAMRMALGASRGRLIGQALVEAVCLTAAAGVLGFGLASGTLAAIVHLAGDAHAMPRLEGVRIDATAVGAAAAFTLVVALGVGLVPALAAGQHDIAFALAAGARSSAGRTATRVRRCLVAGEVALALVLLVGAGLLVRSVHQLLSVDTGFDSRQVLTFQLSMPEWIHDTPGKRSEAFAQLLAAIDRLPGVESSGAATWLPMTDIGAATSYEALGEEAPPVGLQPSADIRIVAGHYFQTLGIPLVHGRLFTQADRDHVLIVNEALANQAWPGADPIGRQLKVAWHDDRPNTVIGVVGDVLPETPDMAPRPTIYFPHAFDPWSTMAVAVRSEGDPAALLPAIQRLAGTLQPDAPLTAARTMDQVILRSISTRRLTMRLLAIFAAGAVTLCGVGLFALLAYTVSVRRREIGIRVALGAAKGDIVRWVLRDAARVTVPGLAVGLAAAWVAAGYVRELLFGIDAHDAVTFLLVPSIVAAVSLAAAWVPARVAAQVSAGELMRAE
jgi:putative ABC transport system permease protein